MKMRKPVPRPKKSNDLPSEVKTYFLTEEELEKYRNMPPPRDYDGKILKKGFGDRFREV